ncbi:hypothetical protein NEIRO03_2657 [Nematocida sp. AWRm78]|nr:hypothetical protein NEIRO02_2667 [Nematocida sp. AWRm79]KAI5187999.1 hypothetical protein NEIRO03_2657 [Nematocida sp. AWRm78]
MAIIHIIDSKLRDKVNNSFPDRKAKIQLNDINGLYSMTYSRGATPHRPAT